jgi:ABC-type nitrate/sulfonate/bicarbonate transport system substrate-binding protein
MTMIPAADFPRRATLLSVLALAALAASVGAGVTQFVALPTEESAEALLAGKIDAAFVSAPWNAPVV